MEIFIDTANVEEIKKYAKLGVIDGVTTNPALVAKEGKDFREVVTEICSIVNGPVSAEVVSKDADAMIKEARLISKLHKNIIVKLPATIAGFEALNIVAKEGIKTNFTIVYTATQAMAAAKLGATYVSPFIGRLDVTSTGGSELIDEIVTIYNNYNFDTKISDIESTIRKILIDSELKQELLETSKHFLNQHFTNQGNASEKLANLLDKF